MIDNDIEFYPLSTIKKKGIDVIIKSILNDNPLFVVLNLAVFDKQFAPSIVKNKDYDVEGLKYSDFEKITKQL